MENIFFFDDEQIPPSQRAQRNATSDEQSSQGRFPEQIREDPVNNPIFRRRQFDLQRAQNRIAIVAQFNQGARVFNTGSNNPIFRRQGRPIPVRRIRPVRRSIP